MSETSSGPGGSPFANWKFISAAVLIAAVIVAGIVFVVVPRSSSGEEPSSPTSAPTAPAEGAGESSSACGLEDGDQAVPESTAPAANWALVGRIAAPTDPATFGPGVVDDDGFRSCFAHSPSGALYAALNFYAQGSSPELALRNLQENLAPGEGRDAAVAAADASSVGSDSGVSVQFAGYKVIDYDDRSATIDVVVRGSNAVIVSFVTELVWAEGDWKVLMQDTGKPAVSPRQLTTLNGYVPWSGA